MSTPGLSPTLDGFDPLSSDDITAGTSIAAVLEEASKRIVHNILKSYTGYFDVFSELLQNALDAVEQRKLREGAHYRPRIWVTIDIPESIVRVVDNGIGMNEREFKYCLRPSVSFKNQADLRGHKGVGATFVAYGFSFLKLQSKQPGSSLAAILRQGRQVGDLVVNAIDYGCSGGSSNQTLAWMKQLNCTTGGGNGAQSIAPGAASVTMGYTIANDEWGMVAVDIVAGASGQNGPYTVTATSQADPTKSATATVTISVPTTVAVSLSPTSASILANGTQQFTATVTGTTNTAVTWSATGGSVSSTGLYTAPSTAGTWTVKATSVADPTKSASATCTITAPVISVAISPNRLLKN